MENNQLDLAAWINCLENATEVETQKAILEVLYEGNYDLLHVPMLRIKEVFLPITLPEHSLHRLAIKVRDVMIAKVRQLEPFRVTYPLTFERVTTVQSEAHYNKLQKLSAEKLEALRQTEENLKAMLRKTRKMSKMTNKVKVGIMGVWEPVWKSVKAQREQNLLQSLVDYESYESHLRSVNFLGGIMENSFNLPSFRSVLPVASQRQLEWAAPADSVDDEGDIEVDVYDKKEKIKTRKIKDRIRPKAHEMELHKISENYRKSQHKAKKRNKVDDEQVRIIADIEENIKSFTIAKKNYLRTQKSLSNAINNLAEHETQVKCKAKNSFHQAYYKCFQLELPKDD